MCFGATSCREHISVCKNKLTSTHLHNHVPYQQQSYNEPNFPNFINKTINIDNHRSCWWWLRLASQSALGTLNLSSTTESIWIRASYEWRAVASLETALFFVEPFLRLVSQKHVLVSYNLKRLRWHTCPKFRYSVLRFSSSIPSMTNKSFHQSPLNAVVKIKITLASTYSVPRP